ncbi:MAG: DUF4388 domain-containing protein [Planctomycetota bacterium]
MLPLVEIVARDPGRCPVLVAGGRMVYAHPEILKDESDRICAQALSVLAPAAEELARAAAAGRRLEPLELSCPEEGCGAAFTMKALPFGAGEAAPRQRVPARSSTIIRRLERLTSPPTGGGPFLSRLEPELIEEIVDLSTIETYPEPTVIIRAGQEGRALYVVAEGGVEVVRESEEGREVVLVALGKGECLGEMSLLTGQPASATVRTRGEGTTVLVIPRPAFEDLLRRRPTLASEFSRIIAGRLYNTNVSLEAETSRDIAGRLSMIGVVDLIQTLHASRRTGTLTLESAGDREGYVGFRNGAVTSAVVGELKGAEGAYDLLTWEDGNFRFEGGEPALDADPEARIELDTMALLMEGMRRLDERGSG